MLNFYSSLLIMFLAVVNVNAQKSCCSGNSKDKAKCVNTKEQSSCCTITMQETTAGCTPANCRGAKTKFGEAKVISELRKNLIELKSKMELYTEHEFTNQAITVHGIVGETDDKSLDILSEHLAIIESEIYSFVKQDIPVSAEAKNKAVLVKQLNKKITTLSQLL